MQSAKSQLRFLQPLLLLSLLATPVKCLTTFHPNCTFPDKRYDFVAMPNIRSTLDIVWSCLVTFVACTYTVLHMNVPEQRDGRDEGFKGWLKWSWDRTSKNLLWMWLTFLLPEYYALMAFADRRSAISYEAKFKELNAHPPGGWTRTHAFFANMGGFAIRSTTHRRPRDLTHLTAQSLLELIRHEHRYVNPESLPSQDDIEDRSKRDALSKSLVILQILYFGANCITRLSKGLPTTQLEMSVVATAICSIVSFTLLFQKPQSVNAAVVLLSYDGRMPGSVRTIVENDENRRKSQGTIANSYLGFWLGSESTVTKWDLPFLTLLAASLGAVHVGAWNFHYPSDTIKWLWRICSIIFCAWVPFLSSIYYLSWFVAKCANLDFFDLMNRRVVTNSRLWNCLYILYWALRCILLTLMIICLRGTPTRGYQTTWADNLPHI